MEKNIKNDYPIYGIFEYGGSNGHADVIYGTMVYTDGSHEDTIRVMDPEFGFATATYTSSGFRYTSLYSNVTLTLVKASKMY